MNVCWLKKYFRLRTSNWTYHPFRPQSTRLFHLRRRLWTTIALRSVRQENSRRPKNVKFILTRWLCARKSKHLDGRRKGFLVQSDTFDKISFLAPLWARLQFDEKTTWQRRFLRSRCWHCAIRWERHLHPRHQGSAARWWLEEERCLYIEYHEDQFARPSSADKATYSYISTKRSRNWRQWR